MFKTHTVSWKGIKFNNLSFYSTTEPGNISLCYISNMSLWSLKSSRMWKMCLHINESYLANLSLKIEFEVDWLPSTISTFQSLLLWWLNNKNVSNLHKNTFICRK